MSAAGLVVSAAGAGATVVSAGLVVSPLAEAVSPELQAAKAAAIAKTKSTFFIFCDFNFMIYGI